MAETYDQAPSMPDVPFGSAIRVQMNVIGALMMRELHTRFGRDNIGYLWLFVEPMILAFTVALIHSFTKSRDHGVTMVAVTLAGYLTFIQFRSTVIRAEGTVDANKPLLYHRSVTILAMLLARSLLEAATTIMPYALLMGGAIVLGYASFPARILYLICGIGFMTWFSFAFSLVISAATHFSRLAERLIHPTLYLLMPASGAFFILKWIPEPFRSKLAWVPLVQIEELIRYGQFESLNDRYVSVPYLVAWCAIPTFLGLTSVRMLRRHLHLD